MSLVPTLTRKLDNGVVHRSKAPLCVRLAAGYLILLAAVCILPLAFPEPFDRPSVREVEMEAAVITICLVVGFGLVLSRRWAWAPGVSIAAVALVTSLPVLLTPDKWAIPILNLMVWIFVVAPAVAGLAALFSPPSLRWLGGVRASET